MICIGGTNEVDICKFTIVWIFKEKKRTSVYLPFDKEASEFVRYE